MIRVLVEQKELDLNVRDKWDSTPLYYACLCGHTNLVRYLLKSGINLFEIKIKVNYQ